MYESDSTIREIRQGLQKFPPVNFPVIAQVSNAGLIIDFIKV